LWRSRPFVSASAVAKAAGLRVACFKLDSSNLLLVHLSSTSL
jgi:hypothetical protein